MPITYVGSGANAVKTATTGTTLSVFYPTGLQAGDLLLLDMGGSAATQFATTAAPGFTRRVANTAGGSSPAQAIFWRISNGTETNAVTVTTPSTVTAMGRMYAYRGVDQTNPFDVADALYTSSVTATAYDIPSQTPTMLGVTFHLHAVSNVNTGTFTPPTVPAAHTELTDATGTSPGNWAGHLLDWQSTSATGVRNLVRSATVRGAAASVALRPATTSTTHAAAGAVTAGSTTTAATVLRATAAGAVAAVVVATAAATTILPTPGTASATTSASGAAGVIVAPQQYPAAGAVGATTANAGAAAGRFGTSGTASALSATTAAATSRLLSGGTVAAEATATGSAASRLAATGTTAATSAAIGSATVIGGPVALPAAGSVVVVSFATGEVLARFAVAGTTPAASGATGQATATLHAAGTTTAEAGATCTANLLAAAAGQVDATSDTTGTADNLGTPSDFTGRILTARVATPAAFGVLTIPDQSATVDANSATGRLTTLTATGDIT